LTTTINQEAGYSHSTIGYSLNQEATVLQSTPIPPPRALYELRAEDLPLSFHGARYRPIVLTIRSLTEVAEVCTSVAEKVTSDCVQDVHAMDTVTLTDGNFKGDELVDVGSGKTKWFF